MRVFRVDNPHTKPVPFWEWLIAEVRARRTRTSIFLAEAFTRPAMMTTLAKVGFSQSYTYFTWKNTKAELVEFVEQARARGRRTTGRTSSPTRRTSSTSTSRHGGRPAFEARLVLAATLSPSYGIYSGYEHLRERARARGSEEYLDSEKYELKERRLDGPLLPLVQRLNEIRRANPALQRFDNLAFLETRERAPDRATRSAGATTPSSSSSTSTRSRRARASRSCPPGSACRRLRRRRLLTGERYRWRTGRNYVRLGPGGAHVLRVRT